MSGAILLITTYTNLLKTMILPRFMQSGPLTPVAQRYGNHSGAGGGEGTEVLLHRPYAACFSSASFVANSLGVRLPSEECGLWLL